MDYETTLTSGLGILSGIITIIAIIAGLISIFSIITMWKIFKKAGKNGWEAIVPFYNMFVLFEITWGNGIIMLSLLASIIPVIGSIIIFVILVLTYNKLAKSFGKSTGFTIGLIFLNPIFMGILAFDKSEYLGVQKKNKNPTTTEPQQVNSIPNNVPLEKPTISPQTEQQPTDLFQVPQGMNTTINNITEQPNNIVTPQQPENQLINNAVQPQTIISDNQSINPVNVVPQQNQQVNNMMNPVQMAQQPSNPNINNTITCPYCHNQINSNAVFCTSCGKQLK